jgi:small neutral amino acid transporter SnatA (MarC family)
MTILGLTLGEFFALLFIAMGPIRVIAYYVPIARNLSADVQRTLAWRTILTGFLVVCVIILIGAGVVKNFHLDLSTLMLAAGLTYIILAVPMLLAEPSDIPPVPQIKDPLRLAISPLAVPAMITPLGIATLFGVAAYVPDLATILVFLSMIVAILIINFAGMLLALPLARCITRPILEVFQKIFGFVLLAFGSRLILGALAHLGIIPMRGF